MNEQHEVYVKKHNLLTIFFLLLAVNISLFYFDWKSSHKEFVFAMLDVGQGDGFFIESPTGTQIMFDAGPARKILGPLQKIISPFDRTIDAIIITNPDADHIGGLADILKNYKVSAVFESGALTDSKTYQNIRTEMEKQNIPDILAKRGMRLNLGGGVFIDILFPDRDVSAWATNDGSVVARLSYGDTSFMLTGDATVKTEKIILSENSSTQLKSDILKVGHHGSRTSSSNSFLEAVLPAYTLISVGKDNKYGHPHPEILDALKQLGAQVFRTDLEGTIILKCAKMGVCEIKK